MASSQKHLKITLNAPVTLSFSALCIIALILGQVTGGRLTQLFFMTYHSALSSILTWLRFFTHVLGHADLGHLIGNMSYILLLGPMIEEKYGSAMIAELIVITAFVTGIVNYILFPHAGLLGASGVVFAFIILSSITGMKSGEIPLTFILVACIYLGQQVYDGIFVKDNIANFAHIIGGIVGAVCGFGFAKKK